MVAGRGFSEHNLGRRAARERSKRKRSTVDGEGRKGQKKEGMGNITGEVREREEGREEGDIGWLLMEPRGMESGVKWKWKQQSGDRNETNIILRNDAGEVGKSADASQKPTFLFLCFIFILQKFNVGARK